MTNELITNITQLAKHVQKSDQIHRNKIRLDTVPIEMTEPDLRPGEHVIYTQNNIPAHCIVERLVMTVEWTENGIHAVYETIIRDKTGKIYHLSYTETKKHLQKLLKNHKPA